MCFMKRIILAVTALMTITLSASAMSSEQARREALFLTDKMAYELNLSEEQYDAAYEINLDYLMGVTNVDDVYSYYWTQRNLDMSYILLDWQWNAFRAATYFYRPLYWDGGYWHFGVYARYPRRSFFYFDRPTVFVTYRGGHSWHANGGHSYYHGRRDDFRPAPDRHIGMRDNRNNGFSQRRNGGFGNNTPQQRGSSTRVTVNNGNGSRNGGFNARRGNTTTTTTTAPSNSGIRNNGGFGTTRSTTTPSNSGVRSNSGFSGSRGSSAGSSRGGFGTTRSVSTPSNSGVRSSGGFGGSRGNSVGSGTRSSGGFGGGTVHGGGFGGRR